MLRPQRALAEERAAVGRASRGTRTNLGYDRIAGFEFRSSVGEEEKAAAGINSHLPPPPTHSPISLPPSLSLRVVKRAGKLWRCNDGRSTHRTVTAATRGRGRRTDGRGEDCHSRPSVGPLCCAQSTFQAIWKLLRHVVPLR